MAKGKANHVVISKKELLLPTMEFLPLNDAGQGFFVRELGGKALLEFYELVKGKDLASLSNVENIEIMTVLVHMTACNADGSPYFASKEETEQFANTSFAQLQLAAEKAEEMSGMEAKDTLPNDQTVSSTTS
jgi:hypothetical protein